MLLGTEGRGKVEYYIVISQLFDVLWTTLVCEWFSGEGFFRA